MALLMSKVSSRKDLQSACQVAREKSIGRELEIIRIPHLRRAFAFVAESISNSNRIELRFLNDENEETRKHII